MSKCRDCKHFRLNGEEGSPYRGWGTCIRITDDLPSSRDESAPGPDDGRLAIAWDHEGYSAGVYISPDFGCVMFDEGREREE